MIRFIAVLLTALIAAQAAGREWTDSTGMYTQRADLIDFDERIAVLKKADGRLVAVPIDKLSTADREYLRSKPGQQDVAAAASKDRTWTLADGQKLSGRVLEYVQRDVVITRAEGMLLINGTPLKDLSDLQRLVILQMVAQLEKIKLKDMDELESFVVSRQGTLKYAVDGVILELAGGTPFAVPFFLFSQQDLKVLQPGWETWLAAQKDERQRQQESTLLRSLANEYQKHRQVDRRIQMLQLASQWFDLWEVELMAPNGAVTAVVIPARNSLMAEIAAQSQFPNSALVGTRRLERRY